MGPTYGFVRLGEDRLNLAGQRLGAAERPVYRQLLEQIAAGRSEFSFEGITPDVFRKASAAVLDDHPEIFWLDGSGSIRTRTVTEGARTSVTVTFLPEHPADMRTVRQQTAELRTVRSSVTSRALQYDSLFDRVLFVHDYIVEHTRYDSADDAYNAYGCLVNRRAVCAGYTDAFQLLMQDLGIVCGRVSGRAGGERHAWNYLVLGNESYYMDVTWDDPLRTDGSGRPCRDGKGGKSYEYFCVTLEDILRTHTPDREADVPLCRGTKYNYHRCHGFFMERYTFERASEIIRRQAAGGVITMRFGSPAEQKKAVEDLLENQKFWKIDLPVDIGTSLTYQRGTSGLVLTIMPSVQAKSVR